ncbi:MAG TPA: glycine cleavage system aminomethyltransferase GcvT [Candidatus Binataceae bacterium]|nr:glycine cleavage system aminomethyltransferase GcvT [Candidatus Binataceae bacterium]
MSLAKRTVLFAEHQKLGARMTTFAGFEMPVQYSGIIEEHMAVRRAAGVFDLSHMGEFELRGPRALELLERALTNSAARLRDGQAQYTLLCAHDGGTIDDLIVYRLGAERFMLCVNASNIEVDREWLLSLNHHGADFLDTSEETALVAVQGPMAIAILKKLAAFAIDEVQRFGVADGEVGGVRCLAARTGYTGEDGFEFFVAAEDGARLFGEILLAGEGDHIKPCGLGARDTLRLEAGLPLYGHELDRNTSPLEAGLSTYLKFGRGFVGEEALGAQRANGLKKNLIGIATDDARTIARQGYPILIDDAPAGTVTSGTFAPALERPIAMAYVNGSERPAVGAKLAVEVRNRIVPGTVVTRPFYKRAAK